MGHDLVKQIDAQGARENTGDGHRKTPFSAIVQRGQDQTDHRRRQHDTGRKGQHNITEFMGKILERKA